MGVTPQGGVRCSSLRPGGYKTLRLSKVWYYNCSIVHNLYFAGRAGLAVGDTAVGELVVLFLGFCAFFGRGFALQVTGDQGVHGVCSDLYLKFIPRGFFGVFVWERSRAEPLPPSTV